MVVGAFGKMTNLRKSIKDSIRAKKSLIKSEKMINLIIEEIYFKIKKGGKILLCGNGGSAADAQHLAAEFLVRLRPKINRKPIKALSLATDISTITACGNDYSFDKIYSRTLEALGNYNDILIVISTSGNSKNIINALKLAKKKGIKTVGFLGFNGGKAKKYCNYSIVIKSKNVARIQESHIFLGHYIFEMVEEKFIKSEKK